MSSLVIARHQGVLAFTFLGSTIQKLRDVVLTFPLQGLYSNRRTETPQQEPDSSERILYPSFTGAREEFGAWIEFSGR